MADKSKKTKKKKNDINNNEPTLFPDVWWKSPEKGAEKNTQQNVDEVGGLQEIIANIENNNYGSLHSSKSNNNHNNQQLQLPLQTTNGNDGNNIGNNIEEVVRVSPQHEKNKPSSLIDVLVDSCHNLIQHSNNSNSKDDYYGSVPSDISNHSFSSVDDNNSNYSDEGGRSSSEEDEDEDEYDSDDEYYDEIEQPHRTLGLILFDFIRFIAISANVRCINTQLVPIFLSCWGDGAKCKHKSQMDLLDVVLRIFITTFSLLLILVEFPDLFPFLQHAPLSNNGNMSSESNNTTQQPQPPPPPPPLYITNWIPRGIFYIFLAIICFEQSLVVRAFDEARHASTSSRFFDGIFIVISAWFMLLVGALYVIFGIFCLQKIMEKVRIDEKEKWTRYYEEVHQLELEREEEEEREWLIEHGHAVVNHGHDKEKEDDEEEEQKTKKCCRGGCIQRCYRNFKRWKRRCKRRRKRGDGGICYQLGCRTVDWRC